MTASQNSPTPVKRRSGRRFDRTCAQCQCEFKAMAIKVRQGKGKFCSVSCYSSYRLEHKADAKVRAVLHQKKFHYGLDEQAYRALFRGQGNACSICSISFSVSPAQVDHDHGNGNIRGLLCRKCNLMLGAASDNIQVLTRAIEYLKESGQRPISEHGGDNSAVRVSAL